MLFVCVNGNLLVSDIYLIFSRLLSSIRSHMKFRIAQHFYFLFLNRRFILGISKLCPLSLYQWKGQSLNIDSLDYFKEAFWYVTYSTNGAANVTRAGDISGPELISQNPHSFTITERRLLTFCLINEVMYRCAFLTKEMSLGSQKNGEMLYNLKMSPFKKSRF